jgi:DNA polymerase
MKQMARPRKPRADEDPKGVYWHDDAERLARLYAYGRQDIVTERALYHRIGFLPDEVQRHWLLDAKINDRGIFLDRALLDAAIKIATTLQRELDQEMAAVTAGAVTTINQTQKLATWLAANDCTVTDLQKPTLQRALTRKAIPPAARRAIELRLDGAHAAAKKFGKMRDWMSDDDRVRGVYRFHGASPGRFTSIGLQMQNLKRPGVKDMAGAIEAVATGDLAYLKSKFPQPMSVLGDIGRALVNAPSGRKFYIADLSGIESRLTAWISGEQRKVEQWANYDRTNDPADEPYFLTGTKIFGLPPEIAREPGKTGDLAFGYMGGIGAWAKLAPKGDASTEVEIKRRQQRWRRAHPHTNDFWYDVDRAAKSAVRHPGTIVTCRGIKFRYSHNDSFLRLKLPSGRKLAYPYARLKPNPRGASVVFMDNQQGKWCENRHGHGAYGGIWTENIVQGAAFDLFIEIMHRLEAAGYEIVLHAHDECIAEAPEKFGSIDEFVQLFTVLPAWAAGLPVAAKGRVSTRWCRIIEPDAAAESIDEPTLDAELLRLTDKPDDDDDPVTAPQASLASLVGSEVICCPFHADSTPSLRLYPDHFHCFGCGAHGDAVDWLMMVDNMSREDALALLERGSPNSCPRPSAPEIEAAREAMHDRALQLWDAGRPIEGTLAERYLVERRGIDLAELPDVAASLRFLPYCPFGPGVRHPCLIALRRNALTDEPLGIHRVALTADAQKIDRRMLGSGTGVVKLYPAGARLVVGEGIETSLAAATRVKRWGGLLQPAWAALTSGILATLPPIPGVERLIILVDNDANGAGQTAALRCSEIWSRAGRSVVRLTPQRQGTDFNDLVRELAS